MLRKNGALLLTLLLGFFLEACDTPHFLLQDSDYAPYYATIAKIEQVYDGDTILDVAILIYSFDAPTQTPLPLWPGIERREDGIYSVTNVRIAGIDTPEKRPWRAGRTEASLHREKARAEDATNFLKNLILETRGSNGELGFVVHNPQLDKYGGRVVADVLCFKDGKVVNVADALVHAGHAVVYDGGTKTHDWGAE